MTENVWTMLDTGDAEDFVPEGAHTSEVTAKDVTTDPDFATARERFRLYMRMRPAHMLTLKEYIQRHMEAD